MARRDRTRRTATATRRRRRRGRGRRRGAGAAGAAGAGAGGAAELTGSSGILRHGWLTKKGCATRCRAPAGRPSSSSISSVRAAARRRERARGGAGAPGGGEPALSLDAVRFTRSGAATVVHPGTLRYYADDRADKLKGTIPLTDARVARVWIGGRPGLYIDSAGGAKEKDYILEASSAEDCAHWLDAMVAAGAADATCTASKPTSTAARAVASSV